jgi:Ca2+-binding RTX toxin-like protein
MFEIRKQFRILGIGTMCAVSACNQMPQDSQGAGGDEIFSNHYEQLVAACVPDVVTGDVAFTIATTETLYLFKRPADGLVVANAVNGSGAECTFLPTKKITINGGDASGAKKVLLDYYNGTFGLATAAASATAGTGPRTVLTLGAGGGNQLKIRSTANYDTLTFGTLSTTSYGSIGVGTATAAPAAKTFPDISMTGVDDLVVSAGPGNDIITGQGGLPIGGTVAAPGALVGTIAMTVYGGDGNDTITSGAAGAAVNSLYGENGNDLFLQQVAKAHDVISGTNNGGAADFDTVDYSNRTGALTITLGDDLAAAGAVGSLTAATVAASADNDNFTINDGTLTKTFDYDVTGSAVIPGGHVRINISADTTAATVAARTVTAITGAGLALTATQPNLATGGVTLTLTPAGVKPAGAALTKNTGAFSVVDFTGGNAAITANDGESTELDSINADIENVIGGSAGDVIDASLATTNSHVLQGMGGDDTLTGSSQNDALWGGTGNDTLIGGLLVDTMNGGDGNDILRGGTGDDVIDGGGFNCVTATSASVPAISALCTTAAAAKSATLNPGVNTLDYSDRSAAVLVDLTGLAGAQVGEAGEKDLVTAASIQNIRGGSGVDTLTGDASSNIIWGGGGGDTISGGTGDDALYGEAGNDTIHGDAGNDFVSGGAGTNTLTGEAGNDFLDDTAGTAGTMDCGTGDADIGLPNATESSNMNCH